MMARTHVISGAAGLSQPSRRLYLMASLREAQSMNHHESPSSNCREWRASRSKHRQQIGQACRVCHVCLCPVRA